MTLRDAGLRCGLAFLLFGPAQSPATDLPQADGSRLELGRPVTRIVTLAPNIAEMVFAAGAGDLLLATVEFSDYPAEAAALPRIGDAFRFDLERILALSPDLVVGWQSGNPAAALAGIESLGLVLWRTEVRTPGGIADLLEAIGRATGREATAGPAAAEVRARLGQLATTHAGKPGLRYFYQVSERPLYTVNGEHLISQGLALCGAENAFADLPVLAPQITREAVLLADPDMLLAPAIPGQPDPLAHWGEWPRLTAVANNARFTLPADSISRATPRLLDALELACTLFDGLRQAPPAH